MIKFKVIERGTLTVKDIDKLKEFPKESGINRDINKKNVENVKSSLKQIYAPPTILINKDWYILDGQHTKQAIIELAEEYEDLDLEIDYKMYDTQGKDREFIILVNNYNKPWKSGDYTKSYARANIPSYVWFEEFKEKYKLDDIKTKHLLTGKNNGGINQDIKDGKLVITEEQRIRATQIIEQLLEIINSMPKALQEKFNINNRAFFNGFIKVALNPIYDQQRMIKKLSYQSNKLYKCGTQGEFANTFKEIYNYKCSKSNRVDLLDY